MSKEPYTIPCERCEVNSETLTNYGGYYVCASCIDALNPPHETFISEDGHLIVKIDGINHIRDSTGEWRIW